MMDTSSDDLDGLKVDLRAAWLADERVAAPVAEMVFLLDVQLAAVKAFGSVDNLGALKVA